MSWWNVARRTRAAGSLRACVAPRVFTAALSASHSVGSVQPTTAAAAAAAAARREPDSKQQVAHDKLSSETEMNAARRILKEKFHINYIPNDQETLLYRLLAGGEVLLDMLPIDNHRIAFQLIPGLVQGGLSVVFLSSKVHAFSLARELQQVGIRALFINDNPDNVSWNELDVVFFHTLSYSRLHPTIPQVLAPLRSRVALLSSEEAHNASSMASNHKRYHLKHAETVLRLRADLQPRNFVCTTARPGAEVVKNIKRIFVLPASSHVVIRSEIPRNISIDAITLRRNHDKYATLLNLLEKHPGLTVILTPTDSASATIAAKLIKDGFDAKAIIIGAPNKTEAIFAAEPDLFNPPNLVLCIDKKYAKFLHHKNIRHLIWQCVESSPWAFYDHSRIAGRDGAASRCTVLLSEQEIFNKQNADLARTPSLHQSRLLIANILQRLEDLEAGCSFLLEWSRLRLLSDFFWDDVLDLWNLLILEKFIVSWHTWLWPVAIGSRLEPEYKKASHPEEVDILNVLEEITGSRVSKGSPVSIGYEALDERVVETLDERLVEALDERVVEALEETTGSRLQVGRESYYAKDLYTALITSGLLRKVGSQYFWTFSLGILLKDGHLLQTQLDSLVQKWNNRSKRLEMQRIATRRRYLDIFTANRCFLFSTARAVDVDMPNGWKECGRCLFCITKKSAVVVKPSKTQKPVDTWRLDAIIHAVPESYAKDPRFLARIGLGVLSHRVLKLGLEKNKTIFGSMRLNRFEDLIKGFAERIGIPESQWHQC